MGEYFSEVHVHRPIFSHSGTLSSYSAFQYLKKITKEENYPQKKRVSKYYGLSIFGDPAMCIIYILLTHSRAPLYVQETDNRPPTPTLLFSLQNAQLWGGCVLTIFR